MLDPMAGIDVEAQVRGIGYPIPFRQVGRKVGMRFTLLVGDVDWKGYGGKWVSKRLNNSQFDYWIVMELINWEDATGEKNRGRTYNVSLSVVSPQQAGEIHLKHAFDSCGYPEPGDPLPTDPLVQVEVLHAYGLHTQVWDRDGNNADKLLQAARQQALAVESMLGLYLDGPVNRIGTSGWDMLKGDIDRPLREWREAQDEKA